METPPRPSRVRALGRFALRVLFPFSAMRQTVALAKKEAERTKDNLVVLKSLGADARRAVFGKKGETRPEDESFSDAIARRRPDSMPVPELRRHFLSRKRITLATAAVFGILAIVQIATGFWHRSGHAMLFGALCLAGGQPLFFIVALGAQLRLWQLDTHRLSVAEKGGLGDFMREVPRWWLVTLNPELGRKDPEAS